MTGRPFAVILAGCGIAHALAAGPPPLRAQQPRVVGTASITGVVVDDRTREPIRHALVSASGPNAVSGGSVNTDDEGRFVVTGLPGGHFRIWASEPRYLRSEYGASTPGSPGSLLAVTEGQHVANLVIALSRGAVITGTISHATGAPLGSVAVELLRWGYAARTGERTLVLAQVPEASTDERGRYRLYGVPPGSYLIATTALPLGPMDGPMATRQAEAVRPIISRADVEAELLATASVPGALGESRADEPTPRLSPHVIESPAFYPGTMNVSDATVISVASGDERVADFSIAAVPAGSIHGRIEVPADLTVGRMQVTIASDSDSPLIDVPLLGFGRVDKDAFTFDSLMPGRYVVTALGWSVDPPNARGETTPGAMLHARETVEIDGQDVSNVVLRLAPGVTVSGRVQFDGVPPAADVISTFRIGLLAIVTGRETSVAPAPVAIGAAGDFAIAGVPPGRYRVELSSASGPFPPGKWSIKSAIVNGADVADVPCEISTGALTDVAVTLSDRSAQVSGSLRSTSDEPLPGRSIVLFSTDRAYWGPWSRRVVGVRSNSEGTFLITHLPAGEYYAVAIADAESGQWFDPAFLQDLVRSAVRIRLADGESRTLDLRLR